MVTRFNRRGHYRTNASGTRSYVRPHEVEKEYFSTKDSSGQLLINGKVRLRETRCRHCYNKVYHAALSTTKNIYFNNDAEPLIKHVCLKPEARIVEREGILKKPKKFLSDSEIAAQEKRVAIQKLSKDSLGKNYNRQAQTYLSQPGVKKILNDISRIKENIKRTEKDVTLLGKKAKNDQASRRPYENMKEKLGELELQLRKKTELIEKIRSANGKAEDISKLISDELKSPENSRDYRESPRGKEREGLERLISDLQHKVDGSQWGERKQSLTIQMLEYKQILSTTWTEFMQIRDTLKELKKKKSEHKKTKGNFRSEIQKIGTKAEVEERMRIRTAEIAKLEEKIRTNTGYNRKKLFNPLNRKKKELEILQEKLRSNDFNVEEFKAEDKLEKAKFMDSLAEEYLEKINLINDINERKVAKKMQDRILDLESLANKDIKLSSIKKAIQGYKDKIISLAIIKSKTSKDKVNKELADLREELIFLEKYFSSFIENF